MTSHATPRHGGRCQPQITSDSGSVPRRVPLTDMPIWLMLGLVALGLPRTVLADLHIVAPESGLFYYVLALTPFVVWLVVALVRRSGRPFLDFFVLGVLYGLSLVLVHQALWDLGPSLGYQPPDSAVDFGEQFSSAWQDLAVRGYTIVISMFIGIGTGLVAGLTAAVANRWHHQRHTRRLTA